MDANPDRPIDLRRKSAGQMTVGLEEEGKITSFLKFGDDQLLILKENAIYEILMADQIDPDRTNEKIPNIQQRRFNRGSNDPTVQAILCQSSIFLESGFLRGIDVAQVGKLAMDCCAEALALMRISERVLHSQNDCAESVKGAALVDGFILPTLDDLEQDVKSALNRADHFGQSVLSLTRKFLGKVKSFESLLTKEKAAGAESKESLEILERLVRFLRFVRETRNSMEHPTAERHIEVRNFELDAKGRLIAPTFEHIHPKYSQPRIAITTYLEDLHRSLVEVYVLWIARLAGQKAHADGAPVLVIPFPEDRRQFKHAPYGFGLNTRDGIAPIG